MAEEVIEGAVKSEKQAEGEATHETPSTNKVWDQSEHDRAVAEAVKAATSKYSDYDKLQSQVSELLSEKEKAELAEKSELERKEHEITKLSEQLKELDSKAKTFELKELRNKVLSDPKYAQLPAVYKNAVSLSDNEMDITAEADKVLEQFNNDFGVAKQSFGKPTDKAVPAKKENALLRSANDLREQLRQKMNLR